MIINFIFLILRSFFKIHLSLLLSFFLQTSQCFLIRCLSPLRSIWRLGLSRNRATWIYCYSYPALCLPIISSHLLFLHSWCFFAFFQFSVGYFCRNNSIFCSQTYCSSPVNPPSLCNRTFPFLIFHLTVDCPSRIISTCFPRYPLEFFSLHRSYRYLSPAHSLQSISCIDFEFDTFL